MKKFVEKLILVSLCLLTGLFFMMVGWVFWARTGDSMTTGLALGLMAASFFIRRESSSPEPDRTGLYGYRPKIEHSGISGERRVA